MLLAEMKVIAEVVAVDILVLSARRPHRHEAGPIGSCRTPSACRASRRGSVVPLAPSSAPQAFASGPPREEVVHAWVVKTVLAPETTKTAN